jgi:hypothetical protein
MQSIYDPHAYIEAVGLYYDPDVESWRLRAVGTIEECSHEIKKLKIRRPDVEVRLYAINTT